MVFTAIANTKPKKKDGKFITADFIQYYKHLMFNSLQFVKNKFKGDVVLAIDSQNNWRKTFYPDYKANRTKTKEDSDINFDEFFEEVDKLTDVIREAFPFKVVKVEGSEADDIAGTISLKYGNQRPIILVTSDHDWSQVLSHGNTQMWDPIKKEYCSLTDFEHTIIETGYGPMSRFTLIHALIGDKGDNVPSITGMTEFSEPFKSFLKQNEIYTESVKEFNSMEIKDELIEKYDVYKIVKSGHKKGQTTDEKDIFRTVPFGIKKAEKAAHSKETLDDLLNSHELYRDNFNRNRILVDFSKVPEELQEEIIKEFNSVEINYNPDKMLEYFMNEKLGQHVTGINKFYDVTHETQRTTSLDDFF
jgi:5'-3' exonuclease